MRASRVAAREFEEPAELAYERQGLGSGEEFALFCGAPVAPALGSGISFRAAASVGFGMGLATLCLERSFAGADGVGEDFGDRPDSPGFSFGNTGTVGVGPFKGWDGSAKGFSSFE